MYTIGLGHLIKNRVNISVKYKKIGKSNHFSILDKIYITADTDLIKLVSVEILLIYGNYFSLL